MKFDGGCHCGNVSVEFESAVEPIEMKILACQCSFCRKHNTRATSDANGHLLVEVKDKRHLARYTFGLETAEFLLCSECGVYFAALTKSEPQRALVLVNALDDRALFTQTPVEIDYDREELTARIERRENNWTPVTLQSS